MSRTRRKERLEIEIEYHDVDRDELIRKLGAALARMAAREDDARENGEVC